MTGALSTLTALLRRALVLQVDSNRVELLQRSRAVAARDAAVGVADAQQVPQPIERGGIAQRGSLAEVAQRAARIRLDYSRR